MKFENFLKSKFLLSLDQMKKVTGKGSGNCGFKVDGTWYEVTLDANSSGGTKDEAISYMNFYGGTNWCCDSCHWNAEE